MPVTIQPTTLRYKNGNSFQSADCLKGDKGDPGDPSLLIDDTAGSGDTDKTFSANKLTTEFGSVMSALNGKMDEPSSEGTSGQSLVTDGNGGRYWVIPKGSVYPYGELTTGTDVDTLTDDGAWWISQLNSYTHLPIGMTNGVLINLRTHHNATNIRYQIAYSNNDGKTYFRYRTSSGFTAWKSNLENMIVKDLLDGVSYTEGKAISGTGSISTNASFHYTDLIPVTQNETYTFVTKANSYGSPTNRVLGYDSNGTFVQQVKAFSQTSSDSSYHIIEFVPGRNIENIRISVANHNSNNALYLGSANQGYAVTPNNPKKVVPIRSNTYYQKKLSILGASISSYDGYIPSGYSAYYPHETSNSHPVSNVHDMYWQKVIDATGMVLLVDNASAGSYCTTGHGSDSMAGCGDRCEALDDGTNNPDVIIIQLGGNDFTRSTPLGEYDGTQSFPSDTTTFREAYAIMLNKITTKYKNAKVLCGTIPIIKGGTYVTDTFPAKNKDQGTGKPGGIMLEQYNQVIREMASLFGCEVVEFSKCGMNFNNVADFMQDASGNYGQHPNRFGHSMMANAVLQALGQEFAKVYPKF